MRYARSSLYLGVAIVARLRNRDVERGREVRSRDIIVAGLVT